MKNQVLDEGLASSDVQLIPAPKGKRFANYLIDYIVMIAVYIIFLMFYWQGNPEALEEANSGGSLGDNLMAMLAYAIFYCLMEGLLKGKTIGKFITCTRAVNLDGSVPDFHTILKRSFSRIVPFEPFSFFGSGTEGWHDTWSDTLVIDEKKSVLPLNIDLV